MNAPEEPAAFKVEHHALLAFLEEHGPATPDEVAARFGLSRKHVVEWLCARWPWQTAGYAVRRSRTGRLLKLERWAGTDPRVIVRPELAAELAAAREEIARLHALLADAGLEERLP